MEMEFLRIYSNPKSCTNHSYCTESRFLQIYSNPFFLDETKVSHCTYTISTTNPYPVIAESDKYDFSYSFNANENMVLPTNAKVAQDFVIACTTGDLTVSPVDLSPDISRNIKRHNIDIDLLS